MRHLSVIGRADEVDLADMPGCCFCGLQLSRRSHAPYRVSLPVPVKQLDKSTSRLQDHVLELVGTQLLRSSVLDRDSIGVDDRRDRLV